jgi:DNA-3-methyladenine glycosylase II
LELSDLIPLQFTSGKAEYVIGVAREIVTGNINKSTLLKMKDYDAIKIELVSIREIGEWSSDYALMKCLRFTSAFPIESRDCSSKPITLFR